VEFFEETNALSQVIWNLWNPILCRWEMHRPVVAVPLFVRFEVLETMREEDLRRRSHAADVGHQPVQVRNCDTVKRKKNEKKNRIKKAQK